MLFGENKQRGIAGKIREILTTITHKTITEPSFIILELFSVIPVLW